MNLPNLVTLSRIPLMFLIVALIYAHAPDAASFGLLQRVLGWLDGLTGVALGNFLLFVLAGLTDFFDGYLARKRGQVSNFGILMDAVTDKVLLLGIMIALVDLDRVPLLLVLLILGREFLITGMRLVAATKGVVVSADKGGKQKTVTQILAVGAFLLADVIRYDVNQWAGIDLTPWWTWLNYLGLGLFILATLFTLTSGARYFRRYGNLVFTD